MLIALIGGVIAGAWWLGEGRYIETPSLLDMTFEEAQQRAAQDGLRIVNGGTEPSDVYAEGQVMRTDPEPGAKALRGVNVVVILSSGPDLVEVPEVRNLPRADAEQSLADAGLSADVTEDYSTDVDEGLVISQSEEPGSEVKRGSTIALVVSEGPKPLEITDYTGRDAGQAQRELTELGFKVEISEGENRNVPPGIVISQEPRFGTGYAGDTIKLEVSGGPSEIRMPSVLGLPVEQAEQYLRDLGFEKIKIEERGDFLGLVVRQKPNAGEEVKLDKEVVLYVR